VIASAHAEALLSGVSGPLAAGFLTSGTWGFGFTVGDQDLSLTSLGVYDDFGDGINTAHPVGIWDTTGSLLGAVTVPAGTLGTLRGLFRYAELPDPVTLNAGQTYILGAGYGPTFETILAAFPPDTPMPTYSSAVVSGNMQRNDTPGFSFPSVVQIPGAIIGPNAIFAVPEPTVWSLSMAFGACLLWISWSRRRCRSHDATSNN